MIKKQMESYTRYGDPLKNLWIQIASQGDAETLLTLLPTFPPLFREEQKDPVAFWKYAFELYFPEYVNAFSDTALFNNQWKKLTIWLTYAHRTLLKNIAASHFDENKSAQKTYFGVVYKTDSSSKIDTSRIIWKGNAKYVRDWVKYDLMVPSGQLFACFFDNREREDTSFDMMDAKLIRDALFTPYVILFELFIPTRKARAKAAQFNDPFYPNERYVEQRWERFFFEDNVPEQMRWIFHFLFETISRDRDQYKFWPLFDEIPETPSKALGIKELFLGKCLRCEKQISNGEFDFCCTSCEAVFRLEQPE